MPRRSRHSGSIRYSRLFLAGFLLLLCCPGHESEAQLTELNAELMNRWSDIRHRQGPGATNRQTYEQFYALDAKGYIVDPRILVFRLRSAYNDASTQIGRDAAVSSSRYVDIGYYDAQLTLFPNNGFRMHLTSARQLLENTIPLQSMSTSLADRSSVMSQRSGIGIGLPANTIYPSIDLSYLRDDREGRSVGSRYRWAEEVVHIALRNTSIDGTHYSATYAGTFTGGTDYREATHLHDGRLLGKATLSGMVELTGSVRYLARNDSRNRALDVFADLREEGSRSWHRMRLTTSVGSFRAQYLRHTALSHRWYLESGGDTRAVLGGDYIAQSSEMAGAEASMDRGSVLGELHLQRRLGEVILTTHAQTQLGFESGYASAREFTQASQAGAAATLQLSPRLRLVAGNESIFRTVFRIGNHFSNRARLEIDGELARSLRYKLRGLREDNAYLSETVLPDSRRSSLELWMHWRPWYSTAVALSHSEQSTYARFSDHRRSTRLSLAQQDVIPHLDLRLAGEWTNTSFTGHTNTRLEAEIAYRLYSFRLAFRYFRLSISSYRDETLRIEVSRPVSILF